MACNIAKVFISFVFLFVLNKNNKFVDNLNSLVGFLSWMGYR